MSDANKPDEDKGPDAGTADASGHAPAAGSDGSGHGEPVAPTTEPSGHDGPEQAAAPVTGEAAEPAAQDEPATAADHDDHSPAADGPDEPAAAVVHDDLDHDKPADDAASDAAPGQDDLAADDVAHEAAHDPAQAVAAAVAGAATAAGAAVAASRPTVWSDSGDAPFEDVDPTPAYARAAGGRKASSSGSSSSEGMEIFKTVFFALLIALVLRVLLFQPFTIPSASMEPALSEGDYILVSKWSYGYSKHSIPFSPPLFDGRISLPFISQEPQRGDIVVFKLPRDNETDYIKRLIGLPGDRAQMIDNVLHINGTALPTVETSREEVQNLYTTQTVIQQRETLPGGRQISIQDWGPGSSADNTELFEVPAGHYFVIGDNRDNSQDSRFDQMSGVGFVPAENLIGKAEIILFSWTPGASPWNPISWFSNVRPSRFFTVLE